MNAMIDINGLYMIDNTIFDNAVFPSDINRNELIDMIIFDCRELTLSCFSAPIMKRAIELWSKKNIYYWGELQKTLYYDYNPIENYNRTDTMKETNKGKNTNTQTGTRNVRETGTENTDDTLKVAAYNESTQQPRENHHITRTPNITSVETPNLTTTDDNDTTHEMRLNSSGNIGTMSTQNMIEQQRNIINISLYNIIVNSFKNEFCILKY